MLFFPALLFFVLGLGTSALALSDNSPGIVIKTYSGMDYKRAHGYWRSKRKVRGHPVVAYIGPNEGDPLKLYHVNPAASKGGRIYVRIKTPEEYHEATGEIYPSNEAFPTQDAYANDIVMMEIQLLRESQSGPDTRLATVRLIQSLNVLHIPITYTGPDDMDDERGSGYWRPEEMNGLQYHIVAYIGPDEGDMVALYYDTNEHLNLVCNGAHRFVRILKKTECGKLLTDEECNGFRTVKKDRVGDQVTIQVDRIQRPWHVTMELQEPEA